MNYNLIKANLNLYAVTKNMEDLVANDPEMASLSKDWNVSIQFLVKNGPKAYVDFKNGTCTVGRGKIKRPSVRLYFNSPEHLNKMFDGNASPIPLKGFTKIGFLTKEFPKLTDKLAYYLKPTDELLKKKSYLKLNTLFTLNTAAFALKELGELDPDCKLIASHMKDGTIMMKILPDGPAVHINISSGTFEPFKGEAERPSAIMFMKNMKIANDFFNGKIDTFTTVAGGDVSIKGHIPMLDSLSLILDRIPKYLS